MFFLKEGKLHLTITRRYADIGLRLESVEAVRLNEWSHVAITYDGHRKGAGVHLYVDGREVAKKITFDELTYNYGPVQPFRVGAGGGEALRFRGLIDEVRAYERALSAEEVQALTVLETLPVLAKTEPAQRSAAQAAKLKLAFLDRYAPAETMQLQTESRRAEKAYDDYWNKVPSLMVMQEGAVRQTHLLKRGAYDAPGEKVSAATPAALPPMPAEYPRNRLGLARWLVSRENPLTARVLVNRYWQMFFGAGLVKTVEDFGSQGELPLYQDLLDHLAVELMEKGWDARALLKSIVMSDTYKQSSRMTPERQQLDPENRLLARGPRLRYSAEMIRDQALQVSGLLVEKVGGPSVRPYQPPGLWSELAGGSDYKEDEGEGLWRRSLYTYWKRTVAPPTMVNFDAPTREVCIVRESRTNTPLQALNLMNDVTYLEASRKFAERILAEGGADDAARLRFAWRSLLAREPREKEVAAAQRLLAQAGARYEKSPVAAEALLRQGAAPVNARWPAAQIAAWSNVASLLLNLDEAITKD
jgi:hypothetical protein